MYPAEPEALLCCCAPLVLGVTGAGKRYPSLRRGHIFLESARRAGYSDCHPTGSEVKGKGSESGYKQSENAADIPVESSLVDRHKSATRIIRQVARRIATGPWLRGARFIKRMFCTIAGRPVNSALDVFLCMFHKGDRSELPFCSRLPRPAYFATMC